MDDDDDLTGTLCECGHPVRDHGIEHGCADCACEHYRMRR